MNKEQYWESRDQLSAALAKGHKELTPEHSESLYQQVCEHLNSLTAEVNELITNNNLHALQLNPPAKPADAEQGPISPNRAHKGLVDNPEQSLPHPSNTKGKR